MKTALGVAGWLVAVTAMVAVGILFVANQSLRNDLQRAQDKVAVQSTTLEQREKVYNQAQAKVEELQQQVAHAEEATMAEPTASETEEAPETGADGDAAEPGSDADAKASGNSMRNAQRAQMGIMVGMQYNSLLEDLALPAETQNAVNDLLIDASIESQQATVKAMMSGTSTAKEAKKELDAIDARLRDKLSKVLTDDQIAQWDTYQDFSDEVLYEALLDGQLTMLASGLNEETRKTAKIVLAGELAAELDRFYQTDTPYTLDNFNQAQLAGLNNGMAKMPDTVSEEQYAHLTGFIDTVAATFDQMKQ